MEKISYLALGTPVNQGSQDPRSVQVCPVVDTELDVYNHLPYALPEIQGSIPLSQNTVM